MKERYDEDAAIEATAQTVATAIREHVRRAEKRAESDLKAAMASAEAERKVLATQHKEALAQALDAQAQLKQLEQKLKDATAATALAETQYQQLVAASEQLTANLSRTLNEQRAQSRTPAAATPKRAETAAAKKPIQFPGPARDAKRARMRQGTFVSVDGMAGQLVDLSLGGAQIVLTQMVKPNQVVLATIPTARERIICRGRIVWVVYEQPETSVAVYRTGVKFSEIDTKAVEDFMRDFAADSNARPSAAIA